MCMKKYAAVWLLVLMLVSKVSADCYIVWTTPVLARGGCIGFPFPLAFDHKPSECEVFIASTFPRAYPAFRKAYPVFIRVYDSVQGVMQKILLMSEEAAKNND